MAQAWDSAGWVNAALTNASSALSLMESSHTAGTTAGLLPVLGSNSCLYGAELPTSIRTVSRQLLMEAEAGDGMEMALTAAR